MNACCSFSPLASEQGQAAGLQAPSSILAEAGLRPALPSGVNDLLFTVVKSVKLGGAAFPAVGTMFSAESFLLKPAQLLDGPWKWVTWAAHLPVCQ